MTKKKDVVGDMFDIAKTEIVFGVASSVTSNVIPTGTPMGSAVGLASQGALTTIAIKDISKKFEY